MIKKGDKVRVTRKPTEDELKDWENSWVEEMDDAVGNVYEVLFKEEHQAELNFLDFYFDFPLCVLEKVEV